MKRTIYFCGILVVIANLLTACQSTSKTTSASADEYQDDKSESINLVSSTEENSTNKKKKIQAPKKSFFTYGNKGEYLVIGSTTIYAKGFFGKFEQKDADFVIRIDDENIGIGHSYQGVYYFSLYTENGIKLIKDAFDKYRDDFDNKRLERKSKKTLKAYGAIPVTLRWGTLSNSTPHNGLGKAQLGYTFVDNSPYFTISVPAVHNKYYDLVGDSVNETSSEYTIYFTKAQMTNFLENLKPGIVESYLYETEEIQTTEPSTEQQSDSY